MLSKQSVMHYFGRVSISLCVIVTVFFLHQNLTTTKLWAPKLSMFDKIEQITFKKTWEPNGKHIRKPFVLDASWKRKNGGLSDVDRQVLGNLYFKANSVFEFGLGESTLIAAKTGVPRYTGVDSDPNWVSNTRKEAGMDHFRFYFAYIGKTKFIGYPENNQLPKITYNYQVEALSAEKKPFDIYFVDGRYRGACVCLSLLHAMKHGADMKHVKVGIHDADRDAYKKLYDIAEILPESSDHLYILQLKDGVTEENVFETWEYIENQPSR